MLIMGISSYILTGNMNNFAVQAAFIDKGKSEIEKLQVNYYRFIQDQDEKYAATALELNKAAAQSFTDAVPYMINPVRKAEVVQCVVDVTELNKKIMQLLTVQRSLIQLRADSDKQFVQVTAKFDIMQKQQSELIREELVPRRLDNLENVYILRIELNRLRAALSTLSLSSDEAVHQAILANVETLKSGLTKLLNNLHTEVNRRNMQALIDEIVTFDGIAREYMALLLNASMEQRNLAVSISTIENKAVELSENATRNVEDANARANMYIILILSVALIVGVATTILLSRNVIRQLGKDPGVLAAIADRVAGGDFEVDDGSPHVGVYGNLIKMVAMLKTKIDEVRQQSEHAQQASVKAQEAMVKAQEAGADAQAKRDGMLKAAVRLEEVAGIVSAASTELASQIELSEQGAAEQAARVTETATAMEEMNSTVLEVARNAGAASEVSSSTRERAEQGAQAVQEVVSGIRDVQDASLALKSDMGKLAENAQAISRIMAVISDIADQTNLLALNAAIEAARAGEAGRGFAVVADEVRKLAEKTMASTTDVGNAIKAIQSSAAKSMEQVDLTVDNIGKVTEMAIHSGEALHEIVSMVDNAADQVRGIAAASEQQSASSEEINKSIAQVNSIAGEMASAMREAAQAVSDLAHQASVLSGLIDDMKRA